MLHVEEGEGMLFPYTAAAGKHLGTAPSAGQAKGGGEAAGAAHHLRLQTSASFLADSPGPWHQALEGARRTPLHFARWRCGNAAARSFPTLKVGGSRPASVLALRAARARRAFTSLPEEPPGRVLGPRWGPGSTDPATALPEVPVNSSPCSFYLWYAKGTQQPSAGYSHSW